MSRPRVVIGIALALYFLGAGFLGGMLVDHIRFDRERAAALARLDQASQRVHARLMALEQNTARVDELSVRDRAMLP